MKTNVATVTDEEITGSITVKNVGDLECWEENDSGYQFTVPTKLEFNGEQFEVYFQENAAFGFGLMEFGLNDDDDVNHLVNAVCGKYGIDDSRAIKCVENAGLVATKAEYETRHLGLDEGDPDEMREEGARAVHAHCALGGNEIECYAYDGLEMLDVRDNNPGGVARHAWVTEGTWDELASAAKTDDAGNGNVSIERAFQWLRQNESKFNWITD